jgi:hypothetical protein
MRVVEKMDEADAIPSGRNRAMSREPPSRITP